MALRREERAKDDEVSVRAKRNERLLQGFLRSSFSSLANNRVTGASGNYCCSDKKCPGPTFGGPNVFQISKVAPSFRSEATYLKYCNIDN